jgi:hypothetical protein
VLLIEHQHLPAASYEQRRRCSHADVSSTDTILFRCLSPGDVVRLSDAWLVSNRHQNRTIFRSRQWLKVDRSRDQHLRRTARVGSVDQVLDAVNQLSDQKGPHRYRGRSAAVPMNCAWFSQRFFEIQVRELLLAISAAWKDGGPIAHAAPCAAAPHASKSRPVVSFLVHLSCRGGGGLAAPPRESATLPHGSGPRCATRQMTSHLGSYAPRHLTA